MEGLHTFHTNVEVDDSSYFHAYKMTKDRVKGDETTNTVREPEVLGFDASINLEDLVDFIMRDMKLDRLPLFHAQTLAQANRGAFVC